MRTWLSIAVLLFCLMPPGGTWAADAPPPPPHNPGPALDRKLTAGDITISYPRGLESQAQQVAEACQTVVAPRLVQFRALQRAFPDAPRAARALTQLLGCPEDEETVTTLVARLGQLTAVLEPMFTDVRVYREADLKASGGVSNGVFTLTYVPAEEKFQFQMGLGLSDLSPAQPAERGFLPVVVRDDGSFRASGGLAAHLGGLLDQLATALMVHTDLSALLVSANTVLGKHCGAEPFTRWFCEGAAQWATLRLVQQTVPEYAGPCRSMLQPSALTPEVRARVNLLAWSVSDEAGSQDGEEASRYYAYELVDRLLRDRPDGTLAAVVAKLKARPPADTEAIIGAFDAVRGGGTRSLLLEYVPEPVRAGLQEGRPAMLRAEGYQALRKGDDAAAVQALSDALEMTPSDADMRANVAIAMRRSGLPKQWSERQIRLAAMVAQARGTPDFALQGKADNETWYVLGRVAQLREQTDKAKALLRKLPATHADGQAALKELEAAGAASP